jgi:hypothetical protein
LLGGTADRAIDCVARFANGYIMGGRANDGGWVGEIMERINTAWAEHGRTGKPRFIASLPCAFGPNAQSMLDEAIGHYYGNRSGGSARLACPNPTSADAVREMVAMHEELGTDEVIFRSATLNLEQMDLLTQGLS